MWGRSLVPAGGAEPAVSQGQRQAALPRVRREAREGVQCAHGGPERDGAVPQLRFSGGEVRHGTNHRYEAPGGEEQGGGDLLRCHREQPR